MNLQPLYDVKERLEYAAIAGTGLLTEDFRLQRAAEAMKPLAAASPVFGKIDAALQGLLSAPSQDRPGLLLDVLALVDAVAYTQGRSGVQGDLEPLPTGAGNYQEISYAQLHPLLEAVNGTGGGRINQIREAWETHPEFFRDYRLLPAIIAHLGETYAELADLHFSILLAQGPDMVPLLKAGFEPDGKREMARRVQLVDILAGATETGWYLEQLPAAKKLVRESLIFALRHDPANGPKLVELCQTEKKDCRDAAHWALARSDAPEALPYWQALADKQPNTTLDYMRLSRTETAAAVTTRLFRLELEQFEKNPDRHLDANLWERLSKLNFALDKKTGPDVCQVYRRAAALGTALDRHVEVERDGRTKREPMEFWCHVGAKRKPFSEAIALTLLHSIQLTRSPDLCALAAELCDSYGSVWAAPAMAAALFTRSSEEACLTAEKILKPSKFHLFPSKKQVDPQDALRNLTWSLLWNKENGFHYILSTSDPATADRAPQTRFRRSALPEPLDPRWYDLLMDAGGLEHALMDLTPPAGHPAAAKLGNYFYRISTHGREDMGTYVDVLLQCGWTDWDNFVVECAKYRGEVNYYSVRHILEQLPISGKAKIDQMQTLSNLVWAKKLRAKGGNWPDAPIKQLIAQWENE